MAFENLVGLYVSDQESYSAYREAMLPILTSMGGGFRYDIEVAQILKGEADHPINRLFIIYFPDRQTKESFFANPDYLAIRKKFFEPAVQGVTRIAEYER